MPAEGTQHCCHCEFVPIVKGCAHVESEGGEADWKSTCQLSPLPPAKLYFPVVLYEAQQTEER